MLGRLLNTAAASLTPSTFSSKSSAAHLHSVTEEEHTSGLLFTDADSQDAATATTTATQAPFHASAACSFDDRGRMEFEVTRDIRVIISQNAMGDRDPCLLFDSNNCLFRDDLCKLPSGSNNLQAPKADNTRLGRSGVTLQDAPAYKTPSSKNSSSSATSFLARSAPSRPSPLLEVNKSRRDTAPRAGSLFRGGESGRRGSAFASRRHEASDSGTTNGSGSSSSSNNRTPDAMGMLNCIFGSIALDYRDPAIKFHVFPQDDDPGSGSFSGGSFSGPSHVPAAADNCDNTPDFGPTRNNGAGFSKPVSVMITRMFSVDLPATNPTAGIIPPLVSRDQQQQQQQQSDKNRRRNNSVTELDMRLRLGGKRTPMFAVTIIIRLSGTKIPPRRSPGQDQRDPQSIPFMPAEELDNSMASTLDERFDMLMSHWDIITRTLSELEKLAHKKILHLLKLGASSNPVVPKPYPHFQRSQPVQLPADALHRDLEIGEAAFRTSRRICLAIRTPRATTGQARWSDWKEETRWLERQIGEGNHNKERNYYFLHLLLTEFLGNHTAWLNTFAPEVYARRQELLAAEQTEAATILSTRTVIICPDKMTARRLVFILSAFLPPLQRTDAVGVPTSPFAAHGATPDPSCSTPVKNARTGRFASDSNGDIFGSLSTLSSLNADEAVSFGSPLSPSGGGRAPWVTAQDAGLRKSSLSILKNGNKHQVSQRSATASPTVACSLPGAVMPVAHFAAGQSEATNADTTADSDDFDMDDVLPASHSKDSLRSRMLLRKLHAGDSTSASSSRDSEASPGTWGSYLSSFLGSASSSQDRDRGLHLQQNSHGKSDIKPQQPGPRSSQRASIGMLMPSSSSASASSASRNPSSPNAAVPPSLLASGQSPAAQANSTTTPGKTRPKISPLNTSSPTESVPPRSSPLKVSVGATSGVVDVEVPMNGLLSFPSSVDSKIASLQPHPHTQPLPYTDSGIGIGIGIGVSDTAATAQPHPPRSSENLLNSMPIDQGTLDINTAGWLRRFHPDFALQAVQPYAALKDQVKKAMSAEDTPIGCSSEYNNGKWVDVCTTLFANTQTLSLNRLTLRRRKRRPETGGSGNDDEVEEMFKEEGVTDALDSSLIEAVDKIISRNQHPPSMSSASSNQVNASIMCGGGMGGCGPSFFSQRHHSTAATTSRPHIATHFAALSAQTAQDQNNNNNYGGNNNNNNNHNSIMSPPAPMNIPLPGEISPTECHAVMAGALHKIVQAVFAERQLNTSEHDFESLFNNSTYGYGYGTGMASRRASTSLSMQSSSWRSSRAARAAPKIEDYNNALREGVRKWIHDIDVGFRVQGDDGDGDGSGGSVAGGGGGGD